MTTALFVVGTILLIGLPCLFLLHNQTAARRILKRVFWSIGLFGFMFLGVFAYAVVSSTNAQGDDTGNSSEKVSAAMAEMLGDVAGAKKPYAEYAGFWQSLDDMSDASGIAGEWVVPIADCSPVNPTSEDPKHPLSHLADGIIETRWQVETLDEGVSFTLCFEEGFVPGAVLLWNGDGRSEEKYRANSRPAHYTFSFSNGETVEMDVTDEFGYHLFTFENMTMSDAVTVSITSYVLGSTYPEDTCVAEMTFYRLSED